jgi:solute:Na+ symporter, SSS family
VDLVLSQVTTWIFARSLLNAAILGYLYGIAGTLAYAAYYGSFLTGAWIIDAIRFRHGHSSVQSYMKSAFGPFGAVSYNIVVALRLRSEVFANLLVVGIIFGAAGTPVHVAAILRSQSASPSGDGYLTSEREETEACVTLRWRSPASSC